LEGNKLAGLVHGLRLASNLGITFLLQLRWRLSRWWEWWSLENHRIIIFHLFSKRHQPFIDYDNWKCEIVYVYPSIFWLGGAD